MAIASEVARETVAPPPPPPPQKKIFERKINVVSFLSVRHTVWTLLILPLKLFTADSLVLINNDIFERNPFGDIID